MLFSFEITTTTTTTTTTGFLSAYSGSSYLFVFFALLKRDGSWNVGLLTIQSNLMAASQWKFYCVIVITKLF